MRILKQHLKTDSLLGASSVPVGSPAVLAPGAGPGQAGQPGATSTALPVLSTAEKTEQLRLMDEQEVRTCKACVLCEARIQSVFGEGDPDASVMFIGEGPGQSEDEQGRPFVGRSGELLTRQIEAMGFKRSQVYIANVVKCRPPNNRTPLADEVASCSGYLRRQIEIIRPRVIITLGGPAAKLVLNTSEGITRIRGTWHAYTGVDPAVPVMPTFHPAYLLRRYTKENRAKVWSDLKAALKRLES